MHKRTLFLVVSFFILQLGWSPWITKDYAQRKTLKDFEKKWENTSDGFGFNCEGCGVLESKKVPFGYLIKLQFKGGMKDYYRVQTFFVSFLGTTHSVDKF